MNTEIQKQEQQMPAETTSQQRRPYYIVHSNKDHYTVDVFMPGVAKGDYNISLHQNELLVEGNKSAPLPAGATWLHREITPESYKLRLQLNIEVDSSGIAAKTENGILSIKLPVAKKALPRTIKIQ